MATDYEPYLAPINADRDAMTDMLVRWCDMNSGSTNLEGLAAMLDVLKATFTECGGDREVLPLKPREIIDAKGNVATQELGKALRIRKRPDAPKQIFLGGHYDTVFRPTHPFQKSRFLDVGTLNAPGAADLKGGLIVIWRALKAFEASPFAKNVGWEILINPDEEIGSPGSAPLFVEAAKRNHAGLVFEPGYPDGTIVGARGGIGNFIFVVRGRAAHVGREHHLGRSAILVAAELTMALESVNGTIPGITVNVGNFEGGGPLNVVPELAIVRVNVRNHSREAAAALETKFAEVLARMNQKDGIAVTLSGSFTRAPKDVDDRTKRLFDVLAGCAREESLPFALMGDRTGGVCDGNILYGAGLPNIDTLGVRGGNIHSEREFALLDSLAERARLTALFLMKLGNGEITL